MINILTNNIFDVKMYYSGLGGNHLEFLPSKSLYDVRQRGGFRYATLKYGGNIENYTVLLTLRVDYTSRLEKPELEAKFQEYAKDLIENGHLVELIVSWVGSMPKDML